MAIAIDATTAVAMPDATSSFSQAHTFTGSDKYCLVGICRGFNDEAKTFSVGPAVDGTTMGSALATIANGTAQRIDVYGLVAPTTGNVTFTLSGSIDGRTVVIIRSYTGVHQSTPVGTPATATGSAGTATVDVTSAVDELVSDFLGTANLNVPTVGASQTERANLTTIGGRYCAGSDEAGATTTTMSWSNLDGSDWAIVGVPLKPAGGAATLEQEGFRWFNDDGDEDASTGAAAQDTNITAPAGETRRLRMLLNATGDPATTQFKLRYRKVGDTPWNDVL